MKRFYFACPKCSGTAMSGTDIYEGRTLKCSCGNVIKVDLGELVLTECDSCKKNNAFYLKNGKEQNCLSCGKMLKIRPPQKILDQEDLALFEQFVEIVNKGIMTKVKVEKAQGIFNKIQKKDQLAGYANHIRNYSEFIMFDSEYNSAVRAMNEASKKLEQALQYKTKDELSQLELAFSGAAKRFAMLGGFKKSSQYKKTCESKASACHFEAEKLHGEKPAPSSTSSYSKSRPAPAAQQRNSYVPAPKAQQKSAYSAVPPPYDPSQKKGTSGKTIFIGVAVAVLFIIIILIFVFSSSKPETAQSSSVSVPVISTETDESTGSSVSVIDSDGTEKDDAYAVFVGMVNDENYDLYCLSLYNNELKGYKDSDSIFESHKSGFYEKFKSTAENYQSADTFDSELTIEVLEGMSCMRGYEDADSLMDAEISKDIALAEEKKEAGDYSGAADILLVLGDYTEYYSDSETLRSLIKEVGEILSENDSAKAEELLEYVS